MWASRRSAPDPEGPSRGDDMDTYDVGRDFQVVRMRRADGAALAVRRERRLVSYLEDNTEYQLSCSAYTYL